MAATPTNAPVNGQRIALVTGGTDGIGKAIAHVLAEQGISVIVVGSNADKGATAVLELRRASGNDHVEFLQADLSLISNVDAFAAQVSERWPRLHYLVLCAGIIRGQYSLTSDGIESNFALNYLSRFALTETLLPCLVSGASTGDPARILVIGGAAQNGSIAFDDVNLGKRFNMLRVVSQFCEANDVFVIEQARHLSEAGLSQRVTITTLKVGAVRTNIRSQFPTWMKVLVPLFIDPLLSQSVEEIATSARRLLLGTEFEGVTGTMFRHIKRFKELQAGPRTGDPAQGRHLWDFSKQLIAQARAASAPSGS